MKKSLALLVAAAVLSATAGAAFAGNSGDHGLKLDRQAILPTACDGAGTTLLVNVTYTLINDYDSGFAGKAWANDTIHRTLHIWQEPDGRYCAVVGDTGSFVTFGGASPDNTSTVGAGVDGTMQGGYVATFNGSPNPDPGYATSGDLGPFDLRCTDAYTCPGQHPSFLSYFDAPSYDMPAWGWIYRTPQNGTWVNQASGSSGDITG